MRFGLLGRLEATGDDGVGLDVGGAQPRAVLAMLLAASGRIVPVDTIIEDLWGEQPPASAMGTLQSYISRLRRQLEPNTAGKGRVLSWEPPGYRLDIDPTHVDFRHFEHLADLGRRQLDDNDPTNATATLRDALALWRGPALLEFLDHDWARPLAIRLEERRLSATEDRHRAELTLGRHTAIIGELTELVSQHPLREQLWANLAIALYRSGRQSDALRAIDDMRTTLRDELGIDPSPPIRDLETRILNHDPTLTNPDTTPTPGSAPSATTSGAPRPVPPIAGEAAPHATTSAKHVAHVETKPLVGRTSEVAALLQALDESLARATRLVLIEGEPGIGKTRLLEALGDAAAERGATVLWGRAHETGAAPAFWPWLHPLRCIADPVALARADESDDPVARLIATSISDAAPPISEASRMPLFEAIAEFIQVRTSEQSLVIMLDDLQWADPTSLELLEYLTGRLVGLPVLIAATVREMEIGRNDIVVRALASVSRHPNARRIRLRGVSESETAELIAQAVGTNAASAIVRAIHERAEGNPFYVGELARLLANEAGLSDEELAARARVPAGVRDVVRRRLALLEEPTIQLLQVTAIIGREASLDLLAGSAELSIDQCIDQIDPAVTHRLLLEVDDSRIIGETAVFRFSHALVREVVLEDMSMLRRARLHLKVADAMEARGVTDDEIELLASHLWQAVALGTGSRAAAALERAADVALRRAAMSSTTEMLERAVQLRGAAEPTEENLLAELLAIRQLAAVERLRSGYRRSEAVIPIDRAKQLARRTGRHDVLAELLYVQWAGAATSCELHLADAIVDDLRELAEESGEASIGVLAGAASGVQAWHHGRISEAVRLIDAADELSDGPGKIAAPDSTHIEYLMLFECFQAIIHCLAGDVYEPEARLQAMIDAMVTQPYPRVIASVFAMIRAVIDRDFERGREIGEFALALDPDKIFTLFTAGAESVYGVCLIAAGEHRRGIDMLDMGAGRYRAIGARTFVPLYLSWQAVGYAGLGDHELAERRIEDARTLLSDTEERWQEALVVENLAVVRRAAGAPDEEIADLLRGARELARSQGAGRLVRSAEERAEELGVALD